LACFTGETKITMASGETKSIQDIKKGEIVQTFDEKLREFSSGEVVETLHHAPKMDTLITFELSNGHQITANKIHLILVGDKYISAGEIVKQFLAGKKISLVSDGQDVFVKSAQVSHKAVKLFNLHVKSKYDTEAAQSTIGHNYIAEGIVVHNTKNPGEPALDAFINSIPNQRSLACEAIGGSVETSPEIAYCFLP
jgi:intein/homing endonuclease